MNANIVVTECDKWRKYFLNIIETGMINWLKKERVRKLEQWEALLMAVIENQSMSDQHISSKHISHIMMNCMLFFSLFAYS